MAIGPYISIITLNVNGLNAPTKRNRLAEWIQKQDPVLFLLSTRNTREEKDIQNQPPKIKKMAIGTYISIITLNVNGLNAPTKRHRLAE